MFIRVDKVEALLQRRARASSIVSHEGDPSLLATTPGRANTARRTTGNRVLNTPRTSSAQAVPDPDWMSSLWDEVHRARTRRTATNDAGVSAAVSIVAVLAARMHCNVGDSSVPLRMTRGSKLAKRLRKRTALAKENHVHASLRLATATSAVHNLPAEIAVAVVGFLPLSMVTVLSLASKAWYVVVSYNAVWSGLLQTFSWRVPGQIPEKGCAQCSFVLRYGAKGERLARTRSLRQERLLEEEREREMRREAECLEGHPAPLGEGNAGWGARVEGWRSDPRGKREKERTNKVMKTRRKVCKGKGRGGGGGGGGGVVPKRIAVALLPRRPVSAVPAARSAWTTAKTGSVRSASPSMGSMGSAYSMNMW